MEPRGLVCSRCGSNKVIDRARIDDSGEHSHGTLQVLVAYENPKALLFNKPIRAELRATICCGCGRVELTVRDPDELWQEYLSAPQQESP